MGAALPVAGTLQDALGLEGLFPQPPWWFFEPFCAQTWLSAEALTHPLAIVIPKYWHKVPKLRQQLNYSAVPELLQCCGFS